MGLFVLVHGVPLCSFWWLISWGAPFVFPWGGPWFWFKTFLVLVSFYRFGLMGCPVVCFCVLVHGVPLCSFWWPDPWGAPFVFPWGALSVLAPVVCFRAAAFSLELSPEATKKTQPVLAHTWRKPTKI